MVILGTVVFGTVVGPPPPPTEDEPVPDDVAEHVEHGFGIPTTRRRLACRSRWKGPRQRVRNEVRQIDNENSGPRALPPTAG
jgi:hypothetical protein